MNEHITTYNPSCADDLPTILQQLEYLKEMLKKYPSQQWFITTEKATNETVRFTVSSVVLQGRSISIGDFILANTEDGTILLFQFVGANETYYVVEYAGIFSSQSDGKKALDVVTELKNTVDNKLDKFTYSTRGYAEVYGIDNTGKQTTFEISNTANALQLVRRDSNGKFFINDGTAQTEPVNKRQLDTKLDKLTYTSGNWKAYVEGASGGYLGISSVVDPNTLVQRASNGFFNVKNAEDTLHPVNLGQLNEVKKLFTQNKVYLHTIELQNESYGAIWTQVYLNSNAEIGSLSTLANLLDTNAVILASGTIIDGTHGVGIVANLNLTTSQQTVHYTIVSNGAVYDMNITTEWTMTDDVREII